MKGFNYRTYFTKWKEWEKFDEEFEKRTDGINGVYAFRLKSEFGRLIGQASILYIGKADQNPRRKAHGIWYRLKNYKQNNAGASKRLKEIESHFKGSIQYAYKVCDAPREVEKKLLEHYYSLHMEFPPLNRST